MDDMKEMWVLRAEVGVDGKEVGAKGSSVRHAPVGYDGLGKLKEVAKGGS
jgi:hypothetical protein